MQACSFGGGTSLCGIEGRERVSARASVERVCANELRRATPAPPAIRQEIQMQQGKCTGCMLVRPYVERFLGRWTLRARLS